METETVVRTVPLIPGSLPTAELLAVMPGEMRVIRRNGKVTTFDASKISAAITKAFLAVEGGNAAASRRIHESVATLTEQVTKALRRRFFDGGTMHIEDIQDQVELALMRGEHHKIARSYVLYREEHARLRAEKTKKEPQPSDGFILHVTLADGSRRPLNEKRLHTVVAEACRDLSDVDGAWIIEEARRGLFDGVPEKDVASTLVMAARTRIEQEPNYSQVAARLLLDSMRQEALAFLDGGGVNATQDDMAEGYAAYFADYIKRGAELELLTPELTRYDLVRLGAALKPERDLLFTYLGLQTLYDRYFIHSNNVRFELPQAFFMRVAMGLASNEIDRETRAIEFYDLLSCFDFMSSTPTLFNAGTLRPQLSSCYLTTVPDDLDGIYSAIKDNAMLSKYAGGLGNDWTQVRGMGAHIKGTNGKSQGVVPFLKVANDTAVAVNQGGKRQGAVCAYLETWHIDIEEFLDLRKNTGDDRRRTHDMNTANWVPDLFMKRVAEDGQWTLFSPNDVPDLHDLTGAAFEQRYQEYEVKVDRGDIALFKRMPAAQMWRKMLTMLFETGHPWITFKDPCNVRSPQQHRGIVHSSNLCTEICLNTSNEEIAVCFPRGTLILTREGQRPIETCHDTEVFVPFSATLQSQQRYLKAKLLRQGEKRVYELTTKNGIIIEATEDHPFLVQLPVDHDYPRVYEWKKLKELEAGDFVVCPITGPIYEETAVVSIVPKETKEVFDLSLEEDHNFLANGLVVHNCNLGSVNLVAHVLENPSTAQGEDRFALDVQKLEKTIITAMRMLDNVIDINYYSVPQARRSNLRHRPVGLGIMGFQDALYKLGIPYASEQAVAFADQSMEQVSYYTIKASTGLAEERGRYSSFDGSLWSKGILPLDSLDLLEKNRGGYLQVDRSATLDWESLRQRVQTIGMRNSNTMAIAPTATISNICGVSQSIEPTYQNLFVKSNLSGEFTVVNPYLVRDLKRLGLWDAVMINDLKYYDGSVQPIERIPADLKTLYATAFELDARWLVEAAARRQKWLDQAQSLNLYMSEPNGKKLDSLYKLAWVRGLKTTYYLRSMGATHVEKSTLADGKLNAVKTAGPIAEDMEVKVCSILDPECDACQ